MDTEALEDLICSSSYQRMNFEEQQRLLAELTSRDENESENEEEILDDDDGDMDPLYLPLYFPNDGNASDSETDVGRIEFDPEDIDSDDLDDDDAKVENITDSEDEEDHANFYYGKDGTKWRKQQPSGSRIPAHDVGQQQTGGPISALRTCSLLELFTKIFSDEMVTIIVRETNRKASEHIKEVNALNPQKEPRIWKLITKNEFHAYLGLLIVSGVTGCNMQLTTELWKSHALPIYRATMSINRFRCISRFIRFDNAATRSERLKTDKAAPISDIWLMLNANLQIIYKPPDIVSINEHLFPYRGRTHFTQYIPSKPIKYGIKVWWCCDARNSFPLQGILYTGKLENQPSAVNQRENVVLHLTREYNNSGRTIVAGSFFSSLELCKTVMDRGLSYVGTVRSSRTFVPLAFRKGNRRERPKLSSRFGFLDDNRISLISYVPKINKSDILISTVHHTTETEGSKNKPEAILFYNKFKGDVDVMDQMLSKYSCKRQTNRWPLAFFYNIVDVAALGTFLIFKHNNPSSQTDDRCKILHKLAKILVEQQVQERIKNKKLMANYTTRKAIEDIMGGQPLVPLQATTPGPSGIRQPKNVKGSCRMCRAEEKLQRKTRQACVDCGDPVCAQHSIQFVKCNKCNNQE